MNRIHLAAISVAILMIVHSGCPVAAAEYSVTGGAMVHRDTSGETLPGLTLGLGAHWPVHRAVTLGFVVVGAGYYESETSNGSWYPDDPSMNWQTAGWMQLEVDATSSLKALAGIGVAYDSLAWKQTRRLYPSLGLAYDVGKFDVLAQAFLPVKKGREAGQALMLGIRWDFERLFRNAPDHTTTWDGTRVP